MLDFVTSRKTLTGKPDNLETIRRITFIVVLLKSIFSKFHQNTYIMMLPKFLSFLERTTMLLTDF